MDKTDELLLNISSGTPAMKSGLLVLSTMVDYKARIIQVVTPEKKMNEHYHKGYENETAWGLNLDNEEDFENRCREVQCSALARIKREEIIKEQILNYDYEAASSMARVLRMESYVESYMRLLEMGRYRLLLDMDNVEKLVAETGYNCLPVKKRKDRACFEYALNLQVKLKRKQYADFILGITPLVCTLFEMILFKNANIDIGNYTNTDFKGMRKWSGEKLSGTKVEEVLAKEVYGFNYNSPVYSSALIILIKAFCSEEIHSTAKDIRNVEEKVRNITAHSIVSITREKILAETGFTPEIIMGKIKKLFEYTGISVPEKAWNSFDYLNEEILRRME